MKTTSGIVARGLMGIALIGAAPLRAAPAETPNVLFVFIDDMGYADPSCFGNPAMKTPRIDRLAAEGIRLTQFYVNSPICSPSRVAVTTGTYPARWKIHSYLNARQLNRERGMADFLDPKAPSVARIFQAHGYATAHFGKWHMGGGRDVDDAPLPQAYGFDESLVAFEGLGDRVLPPGGLSDASEKLGQGVITRAPKHELTGIYVDRAIDFMKRNRGRPFFLRVFPNDVHDAHVPAPGSEAPWAAVTENPFEQKFFAVLAEMDRQLGRLFDAVDELGLAGRTLVVFTSDNGPTDWPSYYRSGWPPPGFTGPFYGRKWSLYEGGIRMPFIARWPGRIPAGAVNEQAVACGIDLAPTMLALAGLPAPEGVVFDGEDMSRALFNEPAPRARPICWQYGGPHGGIRPGDPAFESAQFAIRDGCWKLLAEPDGTRAELFNLVDDPGERNNLLAAEALRAADLYAKLRAWGASMGFTLQDAPLRPPENKPRPWVRPEAAERVRVPGLAAGLVNRGAERDGLETWHFPGGDACLDLPRGDAPSVAGKAVHLRVEARPEGRRGVLIAHGGNRFGYSLYLENGRPVFALADEFTRTVIRADVPLGAGWHAIEARLEKDGRMRLRVDDGPAAEGQAPRALSREPGDSLQVGADLIQPVGPYEAPNGYRGDLRRVAVDIK